MAESLKKEDYAESRCPLCMDRSGIRFIPQGRVMERFDAYTHRNDYAGAERHMLYWLAEAQDGHDLQGQFLIQNELMGLYRKTGQQEKALASVQSALGMIDEMHTGDTVGAATAYLNAATVYDAFDMPQQSIPLFRKAESIYQKELPPDDARFGGLYNNMGLAFAALRCFDEADNCYRKALDVMQNAEHGALEQAITYLNMADAVYQKLGAEDADAQINAYLDTAQELLELSTLTHDGYYAFVCEKCAPTFTYYGRFAYGAELAERAKNIYAGA